MPKKRNSKKKVISRSVRVKISSRLLRYLVGIAVLILAALIALSFSQSAGIPGQLNQWATKYLGWMAIAMPFLLLQISLQILGLRQLVFVRQYVLLGTWLLVVSLAGLFKTGFFGQSIFASISLFATPIGTYLLLIVSFFISLTVIFNLSPLQLQGLCLYALANLRRLLEKFLPQKDFNQESEIISEYALTQSNQLPLQAISPVASNQAPSHLPPPHSASVVQDEIDASINNSNHLLQIQLDKPWVLPPTSLLSAGTISSGSNSKTRQNATIIERTLDAFGIRRAKVSDIKVGPSVTRFAISIPDGTKLNRITNLGADLALALAAPTGQIRIEAPIPGTNYVGIEVPNTKIEIVNLRSILEFPDVKSMPSKTVVGIGKDISGKPQAFDLGQMPHLLIAGTTGSGKSICVHSVICSLLFRSSPAEIRFIMVDAKKVELTGYSNIPHLLSPVITEIKDVLPSLRWCRKEMEERLRRFMEVGAKNLADYNRIMGYQALPSIIVIIDELNDIMMTAPRETEESIVKLAQMARAPGIHLVLATQRPDVTVITGLIKANIPARIAFALPQMQDSRTIIDMPGAEKLLGRGDMLFISSDRKPLRIQGAFVSTEEINRVTTFVKSQGLAPSYVDVATQADSRDGSESHSSSSGYDPMLKQAIQTVLNTGGASASMLQTEHKIGFNKAARLIREMESLGIVGKSQGNAKKREINILAAQQFLQGD